LGIFSKISSLFGCIDRNDRRPIKTRKGKPAYLNERSGNY